ncbi:undecaprenyl-diphosphate phosphatase [Solirubrobacter soli]|uniref:undecaprenyl-diphosphate phosphatase n=1 Tax=Solirubrobacter soli TaxID=363832 RepID=UPI0004091A07|nr:undecaprenyl-diphosphate phosphatase [Solirubrobacter soli]
MPPETAQVVALGLIQGATELLPVSSSAHIAAVPQLLGWSVASWPPERRKELEVALHAGALLALAPALWRARPDLRTLALSLAPPVIAGYALERPIEERLGGPRGLAAGLLLGAAALTAADARGENTGERGDRGHVPAGHAVALGLAQAAALWPGVSRTGATLAAARALGYDRAEASRLSFGVAGPVLAGATALKAWRGRKDADLELVATGTAAAFAGTAAALRLIGLERRRPFWPYAVERALLAGAGLRPNRRHL